MQKPDGDNPSIFDCDPFDVAGGMLDDVETEIERPDDFGPFRFLDETPVGRGELGDVWLAEEEGANRRVAVKFLRRLTHSEVAANEIRNQGKLEHRYIARLYRYDIPKDGTPWLAMEYVDGLRLDVYCREQNCTVDQRLRLFHAIAEAVQYAHSEKIDHGDLKPSNILIKKGGEPKLLDFGLARHFQSSSDIARQEKVAGFTPAYAAPEQFRGSSAGFRADVYSLGVILYELLAGELPFDGVNRTLAEIERLKFSPEKLTPPSVVARRKVDTAATTPHREQLSQRDWHDLDALCLKAMESNPNNRYSSVETLIQDLERYMRGELLKARLPHSYGYRSSKFLKRNRRVVVAASLTLVAILGLVTFFTFRLANERDKALAEASRTHRIQRFMLDLFGNGDRQAAASKDLTVITSIDRGAASVMSLSSDPETQAELSLTLGRLYEQLNSFGKAEKFLRLGLNQTKASGSQSPKTVSALIQLGLLRGDQAQFTEAERLINEARDLATRLHLSTTDPAVVNAQSALGIVMVRKGAYDKAIVLLEPIVRLQPIGEEGVVNLLESLTALAVAYQYTGRYGGAESLNLRALQLDRKLHGDVYPRVADDLANIGTTEATLGHYPEAERLYRKAAGILEVWYGADHPETVQVKSFVALMAMQSGKNAEAEQLLRNILPLQQHAYGTTVHPNIAFTYDLLGKLSSKRGDLHAAEAEFSSGVKVLLSLYGERDYKTAIAISNLAGVLLKEGQYAEAERTIRPAVKALTERLLPGNMNVAVAQLTLGEALLGQRRFQDAVEPLSAARDVLGKGPSTFATILEEDLRDLIDVYVALEKPDKASIFRSEMERRNAALSEH
jgi:serine/threonine protein kinase